MGIEQKVAIIIGVSQLSGSRNLALDQAVGR